MAKVYTYSGVRYDSPTANQVDFALTTKDGDDIPYLERSHIHVYTRDDGGDDSDYTEIKRGTGDDEWQFKSDDPKVVRFNKAPGTGKDVLLRRITPYKTKYTTFNEGSLLTADQLNDGEDFSMYVDQEISDDGSTLADIDDQITTAHQLKNDPTWPNHDGKLCTAGAISLRLDAIVQDDAPAAPSSGDFRQDGKFWIDRDDVKLWYWDAAASTPAWVQLTTAGAKGDAATVDVGKTTTVNYDKDAKVTNSGTTSAAVFDFEIPKGEPGLAGNYKGKANATASGTDPGSTRKNGDWWINTTAGSPAWDKNDGTDPLKVNDRLIWNGSQWDTIRSEMASANWAETDSAKISFVENKPKTVWGQKIGSDAADKDVSGDMDNVGDVTFSDAKEIKTKGTNTSITVKATGTGKVISERDVEIAGGKKLELSGATSGTASLKAPDTVAGDYVWPAAAPSENRVLQSDSSGNLSWVNAASASGQADWTETTSTEPDFIKNKPPSVWGQSLIVNTAISGNMTGVGDVTTTGSQTIATGGTDSSLTISATGTGTLIVQRPATISENFTISGGKQLRMGASTGTGFAQFALGSTNNVSTYALPLSAPSENRILQCDSSGNLTWVSPSTAAGVNDTTITFSGGDGIELGATKSFTTNTDTAATINIKVDIPSDSKGGLEFDTGELKAKLAASPGLQIRTDSSAADNGLMLRLVSQGGLEITGSGLQVNLGNDPGLTITSDGLEVQLDGTTLTKGSSGLKVSDSFKPGSATSADKLTTARNIWGQSFDGSANVDGDLSQLENVTFKDQNVTITNSGSNNRVISIAEAGGTSRVDINRDIRLGAGKSIALEGTTNNQLITFTPAAATTTSSYTLPPGLPGGNRILQSNSSGVLSWQEAGAAPGDATITLSAGDDLSGGGSFTVNQTADETITFNVDDVFLHNNADDSTSGDITFLDNHGIILREADTNGSQSIKHIAASSLSSSDTYRWPNAPAANRILQSDGSGNLSWVEVSTIVTVNNSQITIDAGTNLTLQEADNTFTLNQAGNQTFTLNVDDAFIINSGDDETSGNITFTNQHGIVLREQTASGSDAITHLAADSLASSATYKWPVPTAGNVLQTDANGNLSWTAMTAAANDATVTLTAGTNLSGGGSFTLNQSGNANISFNVDDAFLINNGDDTTTGDITFTDEHGIILREAAANGGNNFVKLQAAANLQNTDTTYRFPRDVAANDGFVLQTDGAGNLSWADTGAVANDGVITLAAGNDVTITEADTTFSVNQAGNQTFTFNVADSFIRNNADDETAGSITFLNNEGIVLREASGNGADSITHLAAANLASSATYRWPIPTANRVLQTDANGNLSWVAQGGAANNPTITLTAGTALTGGGSFTLNQAGNQEITFNVDNTDNALTGAFVRLNGGANKQVIQSGGIGISNGTTENITLNPNGTANFNGEIEVDSVNIGAGPGAGADCTRVGDGALANHAAGVRDTGIGDASLAGLTAANDCTAVGANSLNSNVAASQSTAVGSRSQQNANNSAVASFGNNTSVGFQSLMGSNTPGDNTGTQNTAIGAGSMSDVTSGSQNTAVGAESLNEITSGSNNTAVGRRALQNTSTGTLNTAVGARAAEQNTVGVRTTAIGDEALLDNRAGSNATAVGFQSQAFANNTAVAFINTNTSVGSESLRGSTTAADNTGLHNTAIGHQSMRLNTSGENNTAVGMGSLDANTEGASNIGVGRNALGQSQTGDQNVAMGQSALGNLASGNLNTCIGHGAGNAIGDNRSNNTVLGALQGVVGMENTMLFGAGTTERFRVDSDGRMLLGMQANQTGDRLQIANAGGEGVGFFRNSSADNIANGRLLFRSSIGFTSRISSEHDGAQSAGSAPGRLTFSTSASASTEPTERLRITSNGTIQLRNSPGIDFSQIQTNAAGMSSETLDSYEEGTWTATLAATGATFTTIAQVVRYTKIGNTVNLQGYVQIHCTAGAGANDLRLEGLPFAATSINNFNQGGVGTSVNRLDNANGNVLHFLIQPNSSFLNMRTFDNNSGETVTRNVHSEDVTQANFSFQLQVSYQTAA